ncbi:hypothetical protein GGI12_005200, partial [Dipsacomyces acuminosporus]
MEENRGLIDFSGNPTHIPQAGFLGACNDVDSYEKLDRIGEGTYGIVYKARHRNTKQIVALKRMRVNIDSNSSGLPLSSLREIALLKRLRHRNIVNVIEVASGHKLDSLFMVMSYYEYDLGTLLDNMKQPFTQSETKSLLSQLLSGLEYCHQNFIIHRDLKPPNALLTRSGELKIADFGLARLFHCPNRPMTPQVATLWYRAPELILGSLEYTEAIDLWSVGCIFGELLIHKPFLPGKTEQEQMRLIVDMIGAPNERIWPKYGQLPLASSIRFPDNKYNNLKLAVRNVSMNTIMLLNGLLTYDPRKRLTVQKALDHPIINTSSYARHYLTKQASTAASTNSATSPEGPSSSDMIISSTEYKPSVTQDITLSQLQHYNHGFNADVKNKLATLTISREGYTNALENRYVYLKHPPVFSDKLAIDAPITDQKSSGRCWIFAGLNMLRQGIMKEKNLEELELSQPFLFFYDKLEKSNWFLENVLDTLDEDLDGRVVQYLLKDPVGDGGQWDMFVALIEKYGVVPKEAYPETFHTSSSGQMDKLVTLKLREFAKKLRNEHAEGKSVGELRAHKSKMLEEIHKIMTISLGQPPEKITWVYYDKNKKYHEHRNITPLEFYRDHVKLDCKQTVSLINDPRNEYMKKYTVKYLGNVVGAEDVHYINLPIEDTKKYAAAVIKSGRPVWFGCDVG